MGMEKYTMDKLMEGLSFLMAKEQLHFSMRISMLDSFTKEKSMEMEYLLGKRLNKNI